MNPTLEQALRKAERHAAKAENTLTHVATLLTRFVGRSAWMLAVRSLAYAFLGGALYAEFVAQHWAVFGIGLAITIGLMVSDAFREMSDYWVITRCIERATGKGRDDGDDKRNH